MSGYFGIPNLTLQAENNNTAAYTYSSDTRLQAYSNYNEPLAHPSGANFNEVIGIINYKYKRVFTQAKINLINSDIIGGNIFISENNPPPFVDEEGNLLSTPNIDTKLTNWFMFNSLLSSPKII